MNKLNAFRAQELQFLKFDSLWNKQRVFRYPDEKFYSRDIAKNDDFMQKMAEEHKNRCDELLEEYKEVSLALDHIKKTRNLVSSTIVFTRLSSLSNDIDVFKEKVYQEFANKEKTAEMERRMQKKLNEPDTFVKLG